MNEAQYRTKAMKVHRLIEAACWERCGAHGRTWVRMTWEDREAMVLDVLRHLLPEQGELWVKCFGVGDLKPRAPRRSAA